MSKTVPKIHTTFNNFRKKLRHIWEEYSFIEFYEPHLHREIKKGNLPPMEFIPFLAPESNVWKSSREKSLAVLGQVKKNSIKHRALLDSIGAFEDYLCALAETVYTDFPNKLKSQSGNEEGREEKLINIVIDSSGKDEIISRIIEEKIRAIFYGNPVDFFKKDKAKLEFGDFFKATKDKLLDEYSELIARRNVIVHNGGRVDRKYLREVKSSKYKLGNKIYIDYEYLKKMMCTLEWLSMLATVKTVENVYKMSPRGKLAESLKSFNANYVEIV